MIAWSYTRLKDFERCPRIFQLKYITKAIKFDSANPALKEGTRKHKILERATLALQKDINASLPPSDLSHVYPMVKQFVATNTNIVAEKDIAMRRKLQSCSWFDKETWLRVKIDLIGETKKPGDMRTRDRSVSIIDWKSGKVRVDMDQLRLYNIAALLTNPRAYEARSALVFVDHKQSSKVLTTDRDNLMVELSEFTDRSEAIQIAAERDSWPEQQNQFCKWCAANVLQCGLK